MSVLQKGNIRPLTAAVVLLFFTTSIATAKVTATARDEKMLNTEITILDKDATMPGGDQVVMDRLSKEFNVTAEQIKALRDKDVGYGEIAAIYAFADKLPGGATDDNVNKVMSMREGKKGWGTIAKDLDLDLRDAAKKVSGIEKNAHDAIKEAAKEAPGAGAGAGGGKPDRSEPLYQ